MTLLIHDYLLVTWTEIMEKEFSIKEKNSTSNIQWAKSLSESQTRNHSRSVEGSCSLEWTQSQQQHAKVQRPQPDPE